MNRGQRAISIYHITSAAEAGEAERKGEYVPEAFSREGFIHCSYRRQVRPVAARLFRSRTDMVLLEIDPAKLDCPVVDENLEGGAELFPHVYGRLKMFAVVAIHDLSSWIAGVQSVPS